MAKSRACAAAARSPCQHITLPSQTWFYGSVTRKTGCVQPRRVAKPAPDALQRETAPETRFNPLINTRAAQTGGPDCNGAEQPSTPASESVRLVDFAFSPPLLPFLRKKNASSHPVPRQALPPLPAAATCRGAVLSPLPCLTMPAGWDRRTRVTAALVVSHGEGNANTPRASAIPGRTAPSIPGRQAVRGAHGWCHMSTVGSSTAGCPCP